MYGIAGAGGEEGEVAVESNMAHACLVAQQRGNTRSTGAAGAHDPHPDATVCAARRKKRQPRMKANRANIRVRVENRDAVDAGAIPV